MLLWPVVLLAGVRLAPFGRFGSTHALVDDWYNHAQYLPLFLLGFWLARADVVWDRMRALRWTALWLALASYAFLAWYMGRSEEHTSELQSLMRISYAVFCLKKKKGNTQLTLMSNID